MAKVLRVVDVSDMPDVVDLVEDVEDTGGSIVLKLHGKVVAVIEPADDNDRRVPSRTSADDDEAFRRSVGGAEYSLGNRSERRGTLPTRDVSHEDRRLFLATAGEWRDVDTDGLLDEIYAGREAPSRPPADL